MSKYVKTDYWVEVWDSQKHDYSEWGAVYPDKEKALNYIKDYLENKIGPNSQLAKNKYYQKQYKDYTSHPIRLCSQKREIETFPVEKQEVNI